eukprot:jgi/Psemu1/302551/fgenesh1_kg.73_\
MTSVAVVSLKTFHQPAAKKPRGSFPSRDDEIIPLYPRSKLIQEDIVLAVKSWRSRLQFIDRINRKRPDGLDGDGDRMALIANAHADAEYQAEDHNNNVDGFLLPYDTKNCGNEQYRLSA